MSEIFVHNPNIKYAERPENDFYQTPLPLCVAALKYLNNIDTVNDRMVAPYILDTGCGTGNWGKAALQVFGVDSSLYGVELDDTHITDSMYEIYRSYLFHANYLKDALFEKSLFNYIIGNPPYGKSEGKKGNFAEQFIRKSAELLAPNGFICYLLKASFRHGKKRHLGLYNEIPLYDYVPLVERPSFKEGLDRKTGKARKNGTDATEYALFIFHKNELGKFVRGNHSILSWKE